MRKRVGRLLARLPLRLREVVAVVVALSLGYVVTSHFDVIKADESPFLRSVDKGRTAHLAYGDVRVSDVRTAKYLTPVSTSDPTVLASSVFVVVLVELTATREPTDFFSTWLVDATGRKYQPSLRSSCDQHAHAETGIPLYVMLCFDVPSSRLGDYRLEVARGNDTNDENRQGDVADVDLRIDPHADATSAEPTVAYQVVTSGPKPFPLRTVTLQGAS